MSFVSFKFIIFAVLTLAVYFSFGHFSPDRQWVVLLISSYVFYSFASAWYVCFLAFSTLTTWLTPLLMQKTDDLRKRRLLAAICIACNIAILFFFKYSGFINRLFLNNDSLGLLLPLGISFYTFQSIAYSIDVYRGMVEPERNLLKYALYVSFFPHISQGPIGKYSELAPQLYAPHGISRARLKTGAERMLMGFFKKIVVADNLGRYVDTIYKSPESYSGLVLAFATFIYALQIYADFSGYMDIACGFSECLGIRLKENFITPYFSRSIAEYWRRWHASLGEWFRDYLYYPVMRSRLFSDISRKLRKNGHKKAAKNVTVTFGLLITWLLIGMWHGSDLSFIVHGLYHGTFVILAAVLEKFYAGTRSALSINEKSAAWKAFQMLRTFVIVCFGYVLFRASDISQALLIYSRIFTKNFYFGWSEGLINRTFDSFYWVTMACAILFLLIVEVVETKERFSVWLNNQKLPVRWISLYIMMISIALAVILSDGQTVSAGSFIYYNF